MGEFIPQIPQRPITPGDSKILDKKRFSELTEILDGEEVEDFAVSPHYFRLGSGDEVIAGTDKGINYKDYNEDRVVVSPEGNFIAVIDGMGEYGKGDRAAEILARSLLESSRPH